MNTNEEPEKEIIGVNTELSGLRNRLNCELQSLSFRKPENCCKNRCMERIGLEGCRTLRKEFLKASQVKRKSRLLEMRVRLSGSKMILDETSNAEIEKYGFTAGNVVLCTRFLVNVLNVHRNLASSVLKRPSALSSDTPGRHINSSCEGTFESSVVSFLSTLADEVGDCMPNNAERHLPHKSKKLVYILYCESQKEKKEKYCAQSHFYRSWKHLVHHIKCRKAHLFAVCDTCISFKDRLMHLARKAGRDRERELLLRGFRTHLKDVKLERAEYVRNRLQAIERPGETFSVISDGADQAKFGIPRFTEKSKSESGYSIKQKMTGVLFHGGLGKDDFMAYLTSPENLPGGANQTIDAFSRCFLTLLERREVMHNLSRPKRLYIQLDNTCKDNKNRLVIAFCEWLVDNGVFESIQVNFLPVGHTHEDVDRKFSRVSLALSCQDTCTVQDLHRVIKNSVMTGNKPHVSRVAVYNNFSEALEVQGCVVKRIPNFTTFRKFVFRREAVVDMRSPNHTYYVSCHAAPSMTTPNTDWERLRKGPASIGTFLVRDIDLSKIPSTSYTKISDHDIREMRKRVHSVEGRIRNKAKYQDLLKYITSLKSDTVETPEWNTEQLLSKRLQLPHADQLSDSSESEDEHIYCVGDMVTVRTSMASAATPFWVGCITDATTEQENQVQVSWYEMCPVPKSAEKQSSSCFSARYRPCTKDNALLLCDTIPTKSILVRFETLTASHTLPVVVQKLTRQALDSFEDIQNEDGSWSDGDSEHEKHSEIEPVPFRQHNLLQAENGHAKDRSEAMDRQTQERSTPIATDSCTEKPKNLRTESVQEKPSLRRSSRISRPTTRLESTGSRIGRRQRSSELSVDNKKETTKARRTHR